MANGEYNFEIKNPGSCHETDTHLVSVFTHYSTKVTKQQAKENGQATADPYQDKYLVEPVEETVLFKTDKRVPKLGVMMVGWGGNNGTTFTGVVLANRHKLTWRTRNGTQSANYFGSVVQSSTVSLGVLPDPDQEGFVREYCVPFSKLLPMVNPDDIEIDGWDINAMPIDQAMQRSQVFDIDLQDQLKQHMKDLRPRRSIYIEDFLAANQLERADNIMDHAKMNLQQQVDQIRADIRSFKQEKKLDRVIVLWTASTERFSEIKPGVNTTSAELLSFIEKAPFEQQKTLLAPSTLFGVAAVLEGCTYINGSPQNSLVPGLVQLAAEHGVNLAGDDFKTGQTKVKSALAEFLINSGIKPVSIVSYNHLGNNDGKNLSAAKQFRSKEITKSGVIEDMVSTNRELYKQGERPDHCIVIKYVPYVGDSKRAMDEYTSEICMHGLSTLAIHNTCEDSLLATTVMLDLVLLAELFCRVQISETVFTREQQHTQINGSLGGFVASQLDKVKFKSMNTILSVLGFLLKSPCSNAGEPSINAFSRQRACIENFFRACLGLQPQTHMFIKQKF